MINILEMMALNLGLGVPELILLILSLTMLVFFAIDIKIGLIMLFISYNVSFIVFYEWGISTQSALILVFMTLAAMALTFILTNRQVKSSGFA